MKRKFVRLPLFLFIAFLTGCQSTIKQNNYATKNSQMQSQLQSQNSSTLSEESQAKPAVDSNEFDPEAYTPAFFEQNDYDDENESSNTQVFLNKDEELLEEDSDSNAILCEDSIYYQSWKEQFDRGWLTENSKLYKSPKTRDLMLQKARTDTYLQFAYSSIQKTTYDFPAVINLDVVSWINYFTGKGRKNFVTWLRRGQELIPTLEEILDKNGLPKDLVYLAMIESGFNNKAVSVDGAVGTWQFMPYTGRQYGLVINDWIDERRDPIKATYAAANYLTDLYTKFGSWHLAAGAYNCGEGCIAKKLQKYGEDSSYFDLTSQGVINSQTANYVPKILAAMIITKNPEKFGFETSTTDSSLIKTESLSIDRSISLSELAANIGVDAQVLGDLNPALRVGITPPNHIVKKHPFEIIVPSSKYDLATNIIQELPDASQYRMVKARIQKRESLQKFAARYKLDMHSLQKSNKGLKKTAILKKGQYVNVPVTLGTGQYEKLFAVNKVRHPKKHKRLVYAKKVQPHKIVKKKKLTNKKIVER